MEQKNILHTLLLIKSKKRFADFKSNKLLQNRIVVHQDSSGNIITDFQTQANLFSSVFALSYRDDDGAEPPPFNHDAVQLDPIFICHNVVESALASLNINKGAGPGSLHPRILKALAPIISTPLACLFNLTLDTGDIPEGWREATVCPIFKKGCKETLGIYRPVNLPSIVCKMLEALEELTYGTPTTDCKPFHCATWICSKKVLSHQPFIQIKSVYWSKQ